LSNHKAKQLNLSFPYNWSNNAMSPEKLIAAVLARGIFLDVLEIANAYGINRVRAQFIPEHFGVAEENVLRMLDNIEKGFAKAL
jgi:hypothetical protein